MTDFKGANVNLRSNPDLVVKSIKYYVVTSWILCLLSLVFTFFTIPALKSFLNTYLHLRLPLNQDLILFKINFILFTVTFLVSVLGILANSTRNRRRTDHFHFSLIVIAILSGLGTSLLLILNGINYFFQFQQ